MKPCPFCNHKWHGFACLTRLMGKNGMESCDCKTAFVDKYADEGV